MHDRVSCCCVRERRPGDDAGVAVAASALVEAEEKNSPALVSLNLPYQGRVGAKKEQAKSGVLGIDPWHLTPADYETHYDKVCIELKRDAFLISGWRDKWQLPIDFDPKIDSRRVKIPTPGQPVTPARSAPAGFSALSPPRLNRNFNSLQYLQRK